MLALEKCPVHNHTQALKYIFIFYCTKVDKQWKMVEYEILLILSSFAQYMGNGPELWVEKSLYILFSFSDREVRLSEYLCVLKTVSVQQLELCQKYNLPKKGKDFIFLSSIKTISLNILYPQFSLLSETKTTTPQVMGKVDQPQVNGLLKKHGEIHCKKTSVNI